MFAVDVNTSDLETRLASFFADLKRRNDETTRLVADDALGRIQSGLYWVNRTHKTADSFQRRQLGPAQYSVSSTNKIAKMLDKGTKAHAILPKASAGFVGPLPQGQGRRGRGQGRKVLAFSINGQFRFASRVRHPGTKPVGYEATEKMIGDVVLPDRIAHQAIEAIRGAGLI